MGNCWLIGRLKSPGAKFLLMDQCFFFLPFCPRCLPALTAWMGAVILAGFWAGQGDRRQLEAKNSLSGTQNTALLCCRIYRTSRLPDAGERIKRRGKVFLPLCCRSGAMINKLQSPAALPFLQGGRGRVEGAEIKAGPPHPLP